MSYTKFYRELLKVILKDMDLPKEYRKPTATYSLSNGGERVMVTYNGIFGLITNRDQVPFDLGMLNQSDSLYNSYAMLETEAKAISLTDKRIARGNDLIAVFDDDSHVNAKFLSFFPSTATFARTRGTIFVYDAEGWCGAIMCIKKDEGERDK